MAAESVTRDLVLHLLEECATYVGFVAPEARDIRAREWLAAFAGEVDAQALTAAADRWMGQIDTRKPPRVLPAPRDLRPFLPHRGPGPGDGSPTYVRPRQEFVDAHRQFRALVRSMEIGPRYDGNEFVGIVAATDDQRSLLDQAMASLPGPVEPTRTSRCRGCDGSGWVDPIDQYRALTARSVAPLLAEDRAVYPCRECNSTQFWDEEWDAYFGRTRQDVLEQWDGR